MKLDYDLIPHRNSKWIKGLIVRTKSPMTLRRKHRANLHDLGSDNGFSNMTLKAQAVKEKIGKLDFIKNFKKDFKPDQYP